MLRGVGAAADAAIRILLSCFAPLHDYAVKSSGTHTAFSADPHPIFTISMIAARLKKSLVSLGLSGISVKRVQRIHSLSLSVFAILRSEGDGSPHLLPRSVPPIFAHLRVLSPGTNKVCAENSQLSCNLTVGFSTKSTTPFALLSQHPNQNS